MSKNMIALETGDVEHASGGHLADNIVYFARALRAAGLPVGPAQAVDAVEAVKAVGIGPKSDFYWALHAVLVRRHEHHPIFDQAFRIFWKKRAMLESMMAMLMPSNAPRSTERREESASRRVNDALFSGITRPQVKRQPRIERDARGTVSVEEVLRHKDFDRMSAAEIARARREIVRLRLHFPRFRTRRFKASQSGRRIDPRLTLKSSLRGAGGSIDLRFRDKQERLPPVVAICDISGSMSQYSRLFLHFLHAISSDGFRMHAFLFGTRLTNVTRQLRSKDVDEALAKCSSAAQDWSGGTRISQSLNRFNREWSRRVLGQGAIVLLMSDGLEREPDGTLAREMDRLQRSCRQLIWLNPLLRFEGFEAKAQGIREMLPHVDAFHPIHNLQSMADLVEAIVSQPHRDDAKRRLLFDAA